MADLSAASDDDAAARFLSVSDDTADGNAVDVGQRRASGNSLVGAAA